MGLRARKARERAREKEGASEALLASEWGGRVRFQRVVSTST